MKIIVPVALVIVLFLDSFYAEEAHCKIPEYYNELGCKPITADGDNCPSSFNCDHLQKQDPAKCYFNGMVFADGEEPNLQEHMPCLNYARCSKGRFHSANKHCFRWQSSAVCVMIKKACCPEFVCGEAIDQLSVCYMEGEKFYSGQTYKPKEDQCIQCSCDDQFDNSTSIYENKNCKHQTCSTEFYHLDALRQGCAPIFSWTDPCCPTSTKCPAADDKLIKASELHPRQDLKCKFGDHELQIGDRVSDTNNCLDCACSTPPFVECRWKKSC